MLSRRREKERERPPGYIPREDDGRAAFARKGRVFFLRRRWDGKFGSMGSNFKGKTLVMTATEAFLTGIASFYIKYKK